MGQCCVGEQPNKGEEYIEKVLDSDKFFLKNITFNDLKAKLESIPKELFQDKKYLIEELYPFLFNNRKDQNHYFYAHQQFFNGIFYYPPPDFSVNSILLSLFPYCNKSTLQNPNSVLYELFKTEAQDEFNSITITDILDTYIANATSNLTLEFWMSTTDSEMKKIFDDLNASVYTTNQRNNVVKSILKEFKKYYDGKDEEIISFQHFNEIFTNFPLEHYSQVRKLFWTI